MNPGPYPAAGQSGTDAPGRPTSDERGGWLRSEEDRILGFPRRIVSDDGDAVVFSADGSPLPGLRSRTFDTARIAHVHAVAALRGRPGAVGPATGLLDYLSRFVEDGWPDHPLEPDAPQSLYTLSFVILASASGLRMGHGASEQTLRAALRRLDRVFSEPGSALGRDRVARSGEVSPYRGLNGNMHLTEALYAASAATGDSEHAERATEICEFAIDVSGRFDHRICEHFDLRWRPLPEHNRDRPHDEFMPYGATVGHGFEWSRLIAQAAPGAAARFLPSAVAIFERAVGDGWHVDGRPGFVYTTDWGGTPIVTDRYHWVAAEAVAAASVLWRRTGERRYASMYEEWLGYSARYLIDAEGGSWHHRLDDRNRPYGGPKPDLYHAYQAMVIPQLPVATSVVGGCEAAAGARTRRAGNA